MGRVSGHPRRFVARTATVAIGTLTAWLAVGSSPASGQTGCDATQDLTVAGGSIILFESRVCDMPDFDQRRLGGDIAGDGNSYTLTGLYLDGNCHCVPTSLTDLLGYYAHKGVQIAPSAYPWRLRPAFDPSKSNADPSTYLSGQDYPGLEVLAYEGTTQVIQELGTTVKQTDDSCGTSYSKVLNTFYNLQEGGGFGDNVFFGFGFSNVGSNLGGSIASIMHNGGASAVMYGRYEDYQQINSETISVGERTGGHSVAVSGVEGSPPAFEMAYNNPIVSSPESAEDRFRQAPFDTPSQTAKRLKVALLGGYVYRLGPILGSSATQRLIDSFMAFYPGQLVIAQGSSLKVVTSDVADFNLQDGSPVPAGWSYPIPGFTVPPLPKPKPIIKIHKTHGNVIAAAPMPMTGEIAYVEQGSDKVKAVVPGTDQVRTLGPAPAGTLDLEASPTGKFVFALGEHSVLTLSRDGGVLARERVTSPAGLVYDWSERRPWKQRLGIVSKIDSQLTMLDPQSLRTVDRVKLPGALLEGKGRLQAAFDSKGRLRVRLGDGPLRTQGGPARELPGTAAGFAITDSGTIIAARNGRVDAGGFPLDGAKIGEAQIFGVSHTGADYSRAQADEFIDEADPTTGPPADEEPRPMPTPQPEPTPQPNLVIEAATGAEAVILNNGDAPAGPFTATLTQEGGPLLTFRIDDGLAPGARTAITYQCRRLEERTLTVDASDSVAESNETDNQQQFSSACT